MLIDDYTWEGGELLTEGSHHISGEVWRKFLFSGVDHGLHAVSYRLAPGAAVNVHLQTVDELYVVISGHGTAFVDGEEQEVVSGNSVLTLAGENHGIHNTGDQDLVMLVAN